MRHGFLFVLGCIAFALPQSEAQVVTRLTPTSPDFLDDFAAAVALTEADDGTWALIGAPGDNDATGDAGSVFAYYRPDGADGGAWQLQAQLFAPGDPLYQGGFGGAVALSGRLALIAETGYAARERAYVLRREGEGMASMWIVEAVLEPAVLADPSHLFGISVALDTSAEATGDAVAVVGAAPRETLGPSAGAAHVFRRFGEGEWVEDAVLRANTGEEIDRFGQVVAVTSGRVIVGAPEDHQEEAPTAGAVYSFTSIEGKWKAEGRLDVEDAPLFGASLGLWGEWLLVGAPGTDCSTIGDNYCGAAFVFRREGDEAWVQTQRIESEDPVDGGYFGAFVSLTNERALASAHNNPVGGETQAGAVYVYELHEEAWVQMLRLTAPEPGRLDRFGRPVALSRTSALVGTDESLGAAYAFDFIPPVPSEPGALPAVPLTLSVFPNPTAGPVALSFRLGAAALVEVEVLDVLGRVVWSHTTRLGIGSHELRPDASWRPGFYVVRLHTSAGEEATATLLYLGR